MLEPPDTETYKDVHRGRRAAKRHGDRRFLPALLTLLAVFDGDPVAPLARQRDRTCGRRRSPRGRGSCAPVAAALLGWYVRLVDIGFGSVSGSGHG